MASLSMCHSTNQGCQMVYFQTKNPSLGKFLRAIDWKMLIYFKDIWNILWTFGIYYDPSVHKYCTHLVQLSILVFGTEKNLATLLQTSITAYVVPDLSTKMYFWQVHSGNLNVDSIWGRVCLVLLRGWSAIIRFKCYQGKLQSFNFFRVN
jgi:hypothetical protein